MRSGATLVGSKRLSSAYPGPPSPPASASISAPMAMRSPSASALYGGASTTSFASASSSGFIPTRAAPAPPASAQRSPAPVEHVRTSPSQPADDYFRPVSSDDPPTPRAVRQFSNGYNVATAPQRSSYIAGSRPPFSPLAGSPRSAVRPATALGEDWQMVEDAPRGNQSTYPSARTRMPSSAPSSPAIGGLPRHSLLMNPETAAAAALANDGAWDPSASTSSLASTASTARLGGANGAPHSSAPPPQSSKKVTPPSTRPTSFLGGRKSRSASNPDYDPSPQFQFKRPPTGERQPSTIKSVFGAFADLVVGGGDGRRKMEISTPYDPKHVEHVGFDPITGEFTGLPVGWQKLLAESGISRQEQEQNPQAVVDVVAFYQVRRPCSRAR